MTGIPAIPMIKILIRYAKERGLPFNPGSWENIIRLFNKYQIDTAFKN